MTRTSISRALKTVRRTVFAPRDADAGLRLAVTASGCAPWAGLAFCDRCACFGFLFPPQAAVASAAGCSIPVWVTIYARQLLKSKYKEKSTTSNEVVLFGDPYGNLPGALLFTHLTMQRQRLRCLRKKGIHPSMNSLFALSILWNI